MEYKTLRIPKRTYDEVKTLTKEIERKNIMPAVNKVNMNMALNYALKKARESLTMEEKRARFLSSAGAWGDMDTSKFLKDLNENRSRDSRHIEKW